MKELRTSVYILYAAISLLITLQFGLKGYIFTLDWIPVLSHVEVLKLVYGFKPPVYGGSLPLILLEILIPAWLFQRLLIFSVLFLSGISADILAGKFVNSTLPRLYAGILYMINPFTYVRLLVGHWILLFSYSFLPLGIYTFLDLLEKKDTVSAVKFALVQLLIGFSSHILLVSCIVYLVILLFELRLSKLLIKTLSVSFILFVLMSSYWLIPVFCSSKSSVLSHISTKDLHVFAPKGSLFNLMAMYGFWKQTYIYPKYYIYPYWMYIFALIFVLMILGFVLSERNTQILSIIVIWIIGFALASGIRGPFSWILLPLFKTTLLKGMRDSQKFVAMMILAYSVLGSIAIENLYKKYLNSLFKIFSILVIILLIVYSFTFFNGFAHQIKPCDFPRDWYQAKAFLDEDHSKFRILFLPWHLYMSFDWVKDSNKLIANPAPVFFSQDVISGKNLEIPGVYTEVYTPYQVYVENLLKNKSNIRNFGQRIAILGVKYIILSKEVDYKSYNFLFRQKDLKLVMSTKHLYIFKNIDFKGIVFSLNSTKKLENAHNVSVLITSPVKVKILKIYPDKLMVFTWPYSTYWRFNSQQPIKVFGVVCGFKVSKGNIIYIKFFRIVLPSYLVSIITFVLCLVYILKTKFD